MDDVSTDTLRELSHCACFQLRKAARAVTRFYDRHLAPLELRSTQFSVLSAIAGRDGEATVSGLAGWLGMDHSTLVRNLRPLRQAGLVSSRRGDDRRTRVLSLTRLGHQRLAEAVPLWRRAQEELLAHLGDERWSETARSLRATQRLEQREPADEPVALF